jgi:hypothetical protein
MVTNSILFPTILSLAFLHWMPKHQYETQALMVDRNWGNCQRSVVFWVVFRGFLDPSNLADCINETAAERRGRHFTVGGRHLLHISIEFRGGFRKFLVEGNILELFQLLENRSFMFQDLEVAMLIVMQLEAVDDHAHDAC